MSNFLNNFFSIISNIIGKITLQVIYLNEFLLLEIENIEFF
jgi:hypothetical protein